MIKKLFSEHPQSVGETYVEHFFSALSFSLAMFAAGAACLIHAIVPAIFQRTGSTIIARLHSTMIANRVRRGTLRDTDRSF
tara:strand:- start:267 stop:509 length:243 start_codon:yes stop_codon:yes gene_type:complete